MTLIITYLREYSEVRNHKKASLMEMTMRGHPISQTDRKIASNTLKVHNKHAKCIQGTSSVQGKVDRKKGISEDILLN